MTEALLQVIQDHAQWAWFIVFMIAFLESLAIIGLFIPGWVLLVGVGTLIGADLLEFTPIVLSAYLGAVIGEYLSFHVGFHYHQNIANWSMLAKHKNLIQRSKELFEKYGAAGVFFGRFFGPARAVIPLVAGISEMPKRTFIWVNLTSGMIWAPLYLIPGILVGAAFELDKQESAELLFILFLLLLLGWASIRQLKTTIKTVQRKTDRNIYFAVFNSLLIISIFMLGVLVTIESPYFDFLVQILKTINQRIF